MKHGTPSTNPDDSVETSVWDLPATLPLMFFIRKFFTDTDAKLSLDCPSQEVGKGYPVRILQPRRFAITLKPRISNEAAKGHNQSWNDLAVLLYDLCNVWEFLAPKGF